MKTIFRGERWEGSRLRRHKIAGRRFENTLFDDLTVRLATFSDCLFENCEFKNCYIGFNVEYLNCTWSKCKFHGKYMTLGDKSLFENCVFENVRVQSASTDGAVFRSCVITGVLRNMIWRGSASPVTGNMVLERCDLSAASFENINIYAGLDLHSCLLPKGAFSMALREAAASLEKDACSTLVVLGNEECYGQQDPVVFDVPGLDNLLDSDLAKEQFEIIAKEYDITQQENAPDKI